MIAHQHQTSMNRRSESRPRVGIALSGGGARGSAHMGVLRTLEKSGIAYDMMSATSIGALAGLMHCFGHTADYMIDACKRELMPSWLLSKLPGGRYVHLSRLLKPGGIAKKVQRYIGDDCRLEELPTPLYITATDLIAGELVVQDSGCAVNALMASMCLPGMASPIGGGEQLLVDGGLLSNLPADVLRARGADIVIGVDISGRDQAKKPWSGEKPGLVNTLSRSLELISRKRYVEECNACDIVIRPDVSDIGFTAFTEVDRLADAGSAATESVLPKLRALIAESQYKTACQTHRTKTRIRTSVPVSPSTFAYDDEETVVSI